MSVQQGGYFFNVAVREYFRGSQMRTTNLFWACLLRIDGSCRPSLSAENKQPQARGISHTGSDDFTHWQRRIHAATDSHSQRRLHTLAATPSHLTATPSHTRSDGFTLAATPSHLTATPSHTRSDGFTLAATTSHTRSDESTQRRLHTLTATISHSQRRMDEMDLLTLLNFTGPPVPTTARVHSTPHTVDLLYPRGRAHLDGAGLVDPGDGLVNPGAISTRAYSPGWRRPC
eukprot:1177243-Prorocentrum_minimum.AAC.3